MNSVQGQGSYIQILRFTTARKGFADFLTFVSNVVPAMFVVWRLRWPRWLVVGGPAHAMMPDLPLGVYGDCGSNINCQGDRPKREGLIFYTSPVGCQRTKIE